MPKALITGGYGFIGSSIARRLAFDGYDVRIITRTKRKEHNVQGLPKDRVEVLEMDIADVEWIHIHDVDYVFHCAGTTHNYHIKDNNLLDVKINCEGTLRLLDVFRKHAMPDARFLNVSTFFVYGATPELPATSRTACFPLGLYGASKLAAEHFCDAYRRTFDLDIMTARLTNVYGQREDGWHPRKGAINRMVRQLTMGETIRLYVPSPRRDFIYIDDAVEALITIVKDGDNGQTYCVGTGKSIMASELIYEAQRQAGCGVVKTVSPPAFHDAVGMGDFVCDVSPLKALGWRPKHTMKEGVEKTVLSYSHGE